MVSGASTGASAYVQYGYESAFGTVQAARNKVFGLEQKLSGLSVNQNRITLSQRY